MTFRPSVYNNPRPLLTPADLDNHPRAAEYIAHMNLQRYPTDFKTWLNRQEISEKRQAETDRDYVKRLAAGPLINPRKVNRFVR